MKDYCKIFGNIQFVDSNPDFKVKLVAGEADLQVQLTPQRATALGEWKLVDNNPDYRIQLVDSGEDFRIQYICNQEVISVAQRKNREMFLRI